MERTCWCGNTELSHFSASYLLCEKCVTLVSRAGLTSEKMDVTDDAHDFYGHQYWVSHQTQELGNPDIFSRARTDLTDRCLHWLRTILKYRPPPAQVLELGCAHGGFVYLLNKSGYDATGLELSPSVVEFAQQTFSVPVLCGPLEKQQLPANSMDVIVLMDVIEHLLDPLATMRHALSLLKPDGIIVVQCPCYPEGVSHGDMVADDAPFLGLLIADEHLHLFSKSSIRKLFEAIGAGYLEFEPAIFSHYDMFFVVGRQPLYSYFDAEIEKKILPGNCSPLIQAMLDMDVQKRTLKNQLMESEQDRAARLEVINRAETDLKNLSKQLMESEQDRAARLEVINRAETDLKNLSKQLMESEQDRAARLEVINRAETDLKNLSKQLMESEQDRADRLEVINQLESELKNLSNRLPVRILKKCKIL